jgi:hypothetical protein
MMIKALLRYGLVLLALLLGVSAITAQDISASLPDIPPGQQVILTYSAQMNENLPEGLQFVSNQGTVSGSNFSDVLTDDPVTVGVNDTTTTGVGFTLQVEELPDTGETPWWRILVLSALIAGAVSAGAYAMMQRRAEAV